MWPPATSSANKDRRFGEPRSTSSRTVVSSRRIILLVSWDHVAFSLGCAFHFLIARALPTLPLQPQARDGPFRSMRADRCAERSAVGGGVARRVPSPPERRFVHEDQRLNRSLRSTPEVERYVLSVIP